VESGAPPAQPTRIALVHDFLVDLRGAERVFLKMCDIWPTADVFSVIYDERGTEGRFAGREVHTSYLQRLHPSARTFRALLPLYPAAVESLDLSGYELVVSSSSAWAHAVLCDERALHLSYCYNPFRYAWNGRDQALARWRNPVAREFLRGAFRRWRQWDWIAAQRTDRYIAISKTTQARIRAYFGRESDIVHPPVEVERFSIGKVANHYALVSELMEHKQIEIAVRAFNKLRLPLIIVGDGPAGRRLRRIAGPTVSFTGRLSDSAVAEVMQSARALIVTSIEEFGIAAVESQAAGRPVIARSAGGALETVLDGVTGCFWWGGPEELARAVSEFDETAIDPQACVASASRFDTATFERGMHAAVDAALVDDVRVARPDPQQLITRRLLRRTVRDARR
jgi:glycosyltransferase involved in cell wall biosynthesis